MVPPATFAALIAATSPAAPLEHGTNIGGEAEAVVAGATARPKSAAPAPAAIFKSAVVLIVAPSSLTPGCYPPRRLTPWAETALVTPSPILSGARRHLQGWKSPCGPWCFHHPVGLTRQYEASGGARTRLMPAQRPNNFLSLETEPEGTATASDLSPMCLIR